MLWEGEESLDAMGRRGESWCYVVDVCVPKCKLNCLLILVKIGVKEKKYSV